MSENENINYSKKIKCEIYNDHFENAKTYGIPHAQLIIADIPYNLGVNAYASNPQWYVGGDNKNGDSELAGKTFFKTDEDFKICNFFDFCTRYLNKEPEQPNKAPAMIVFCAFEQIGMVMGEGKKHGLKHAYPLIFIKNFSAQALKANMKIVNACEYGVVLYREKLPKFINEGHMVFNWFEWKKDGKEIPKIHPTQKPVNLLKRLIEIFTEPGDVVIDPCCGSGSTLRAGFEMNRNVYGFEIEKKFYNDAKNIMLKDFESKTLSLEELKNTPKVDTHNSKIISYSENQESQKQPKKVVVQEKEKITLFDYQY